MRTMNSGKKLRLLGDPFLRPVWLYEQNKPLLVEPLEVKIHFPTLNLHVNSFQYLMTWLLVLVNISYLIPHCAEETASHLWLIIIDTICRCTSLCLLLDLPQTQKNTISTKFIKTIFPCHLLLWTGDSPWALFNVSLGLEIYYYSLITGKLCKSSF